MTRKKASGTEQLSLPGVGKADRSDHRDKRYEWPPLLVDLFDAVVETRAWSPSRIIAKDLGIELKAGDVFSGAFTFDEHDTVGLFEACVVRRDPQRNIFGAEFSWISAPGFELLERVSGALDQASGEEKPPMMLTLTHPTINWSLTGMLLKQYYGALRPGATCRGLIRIEKTQVPGAFKAAVIRADHNARVIAMKFLELPHATFALLEQAIKKSRDM